MKNYEIMFIVRPTLSEDEIKKVASNFQKTLEANGAKVTNVDAWGQKTLAYEIKVGNYIRKTSNHVLYRSTPIFEGDNLNGKSNKFKRVI